jgi:predicted AlkP superfamily pyrophosphatase or phosphodiesterase
MKRFLSLAFKALFLSVFIFINIYSSSIPKVTVVLVVDQLAQDYMERLDGKFNYGFKMLKEDGVFFTNAHHPHGTPTTATGHNALNTGTLAYRHGIVLNGWADDKGNVFKCDEDNQQQCRTFGVSGIQRYGNSAKNIMVPGLTEQFLRAYRRNKSFSLSYKSRAAIGMAGRFGSPVWFDQKDGIFTTSKAFYSKSPQWLDMFNRKKNIRKLLKNRKWSLLYPENSKYYDLPYINFHKDTDYKFARFNESLILNDAVYTSTGQINKRIKGEDKKFDGFLKSPFANKVLLDLAKECIKTNLERKGGILLWVSLSSLDKLGHVYGPQSIEAIDMVYHLDKQIGDFFNFLKNKVGQKNLLFILTSDHGVEPLVEVMQRSGKDAHRIQANDLIEEMNRFIEGKYKIKKLVDRFKTSQFYFDRDKFDYLSEEKKNEITQDLKEILLSKKGVRFAWGFDELQQMVCNFDSPESFYQKQLYPGRSGELIVMPEKYSTFTTYNFGAGHRSAYSYNTNVPLIIYQKGRFEKKIIDRKVWIPQLPVTIARILNIKKPIASEFRPLPL